MNWRNRLSSSGVRLILRLFASSLAIFGLGKLAQIGLNIFLARTLGDGGFGQIAFAVNLCQILALLVTLGIPSAGMRLVASLAGKRDWAELRGYLRFVAMVLLGGTIIAIGVIATYAAWTEAGTEANTVAWLLAFILPPTLIGLARGAILRGFHNMAGALLPREVIAPLLALAALVSVGQVDVLRAGVLYSCAYIAAEVAGVFWLWQCMPSEIFGATARYRARQWLSISIPIQLQGLARVVLSRADIVFVGVLLGFEAAGVYAVAHRVAQALSVVGRASNNAVSPLIARAYHAEDPKVVLVHTRRAVWITSGISLPLFGVLVLTAPAIVSLFGAGYEQAAMLLVILSTGQLTNAIFNPINQALMMTEFERFQLGLVTTVTIIGIIGYAPVTFLGGVTGVAVWTALLLISVNLISYKVGYSRLKQRIHEGTATSERHQ